MWYYGLCNEIKSTKNNKLRMITKNTPIRGKEDRFERNKSRVTVIVRVKWGRQLVDNQKTAINRRR
jgi:hypothetical protein